MRDGRRGRALLLAGSPQDWPPLGATPRRRRSARTDVLEIRGLWYA